jgi:glycosyltransferase involved in cell wall biosynthesis
VADHAHRSDTFEIAMISIVVPAHNESPVIARTLGAWAGDSDADGMDVVVVCNGCTDNTADIARRFSPMARVVESEISGKTHALNLGDQISRAFPRIYADADIVISVDAIRALKERLDRGDVLAVAPMPDINLTGCSWLVRKYYEIRSRLPSSGEGIGGSGVYALSEEGRKRFAQFPNLIADDIYVRLQFKPEERETLPSVKSMVFPPRAIAQLISIRTRAYAGVFELARRFPELRGNKGEANHRTLIGLFKEPRLWAGLSIYCFVNIIARCRASIRSYMRASVWERDSTSRVAQPRGSSN